MWLKMKMYLLVAALFAILYGAITGIGAWRGMGNAYSYLILAFLFMLVQYLIGPSLVAWTMKVKWVSESEAPELHRMVAVLAAKARLPKPRVGISELNLPNAFAFGRTQKDGRVCVTRGILSLLNKDELGAVLGHELSHIKHRDMAIITLLSGIPMVLYWLAWSMMWGGSGNRRQGGYGAIIGLGAFLMYFVTNLLVLYGSRIREYYADQGSVRLGSMPHHLASALYKLAHSSAHPAHQAELKRVKAIKAFFVSDPARAWYEVRKLAQVDRNGDGVIDYYDLVELRQKNVQLGAGDRLAELFTTHPNMLKRVKHLSSLSV